MYMNVSSNEKRKAGGIYEPSVTVLPSNAATSAISVGDIYIHYCKIDGRYLSASHKSQAFRRPIYNLFSLWFCFPPDPR